jgi:hypothetical protein
VFTVSAQEQPRTLVSPEQHYIPDLSVVMTVTQLRHFKLPYAVEMENWQLAQYEVGQVRDSLATAAKLYPVYEHVEQAKLIAEVSKPALIAIDKAIKEKNRAAFKRSFIDLTSACNSCHQQANLGFIVMRVPTRSPFSNQTFPPAGK